MTKWKIKERKDTAVARNMIRDKIKKLKDYTKIESVTAVNWISIISVLKFQINEAVPVKASKWIRSIKQFKAEQRKEIRIMQYSSVKRKEKANKAEANQGKKSQPCE